MKLILLERLKLLELLPAEGSYATATIIEKLKLSLAPTEEEYKKFGIVEKDGNTSWNENGKEEVEIEIGEKATDIIVEALKKLDEEKKITKFHISVYKKFMVKKD